MDLGLLGPVPDEQAGLSRLYRGVLQWLRWSFHTPRGISASPQASFGSGGSPGVAGLGFAHAGASLWMCIRFAGHHHPAAEPRRR